MNRVARESMEPHVLLAQSLSLSLHCRTTKPLELHDQDRGSFARALEEVGSASSLKDLALGFAEAAIGAPTVPQPSTLKGPANFFI